MSKVQLDYTPPGIFDCTRLSIERTQYGGSTWWYIRVHGDDDPSGQIIASLHGDNLPTITYDPGDGSHTIWTNEEPITTDENTPV